MRDALVKYVTMNASYEKQQRRQDEAKRAHLGRFIIKSNFRNGQQTFDEVWEDGKELRELKQKLEDISEERDELEKLKR